MIRRRLSAVVVQGWFVARLCVWLCLLPVRLRLQTLPTLLHCLTSIHRSPLCRHALELDRAVAITVRLCQLGFFRSPLFPRACLRQALALSHVLTQMGYPVQIHFGVHKEGQTLQGHSWVTLQGQLVAERTSPDRFTSVYAYPFAPPSLRESEGTHRKQDGIRRTP